MHARQRHCLYSKVSINKAIINYSREKSCVDYVVSIVAYQDYQDRCRPHKRIFTHEELSAHAHNIVQEVEVQDGFFLAVKKTILCCSFFTLVANK